MTDNHSMNVLAFPGRAESAEELFDRIREAHGEHHFAVLLIEGLVVGSWRIGDEEHYVEGGSLTEVLRAVLEQTGEGQTV
jgi:hypothetical protein